MTEYVVKEIGRQWIVYADRVSIAACADEESALVLIAEHSATKKAVRKPTGSDVSENMLAWTGADIKLGARPNGVERMGNQDCHAQNDQSPCYVRQHGPFLCWLR
jgi:hypothetical protein